MVVLLLNFKRINTHRHHRCFLQLGQACKARIVSFSGSSLSSIRKVVIPQVQKIGKIAEKVPIAAVVGTGIAIEGAFLVADLTQGAKNVVEGQAAAREAYGYAQASRFYSDKMLAAIQELQAKKGGSVTISDDEGRPIKVLEFAKLPMYQKEAKRDYIKSIVELEDAIKLIGRIENGEDINPSLTTPSQQ